IEIKIVLLDVFPVIALAVGQAEESFLQNRIASIPQGEREAQALLVVGEAGQAVLSPAVGPRPRLVVAEVVPGVAAFAVVLANGPPLAFAQVRSPSLPGRFWIARFHQTDVLCAHRSPVFSKG